VTMSPTVRVAVSASNTAQAGGGGGGDFRGHSERFKGRVSLGETHPPVLAAFPGGSYNRRYYDLPEAGYSEAAAHAMRGIVTIAIDHLGSGDSSIPPADVATMGSSRPPITRRSRTL
jgi:hypothetical protein